MPIMPLRGVRISWLILARKRSFTFSASLAKAVEKEIPVLSSALSAYQVIGKLYKMGLQG